MLLNGFYSHTTFFADRALQVCTYTCRYQLIEQVAIIPIDEDHGHNVF